ncbi:kinase-like domain-containing protein [Chytriomyces sp. MP71]|nr:kinase-like domain-containing protein [Chytriomyces sp. MP71]
MLDQLLFQASPAQMAISSALSATQASFSALKSAIQKPATVPPTAEPVVKVSAPPALNALASQSAASSKYLYANLESEEKARIAVINAAIQSPEKFLSAYKLHRVIGFGSNGVVASAQDFQGRAVAVKVIYKERVSHAPTAVPPEVEVLSHLSEEGHSDNLLQFVEHWQDSHHHYLVTELFGADWSQAAPANPSDTLRPLVFKTSYKARITIHNLPFSAGSSDLWSWAWAHRAHVQRTEGHSLLPLQPVKDVVRQVAQGLQFLHQRGFYHGDVKVENILVQDTAHEGGVKLADFGHANHASMGIRQYGTAELSAPEFLADSPFRHHVTVDGRAADVFALGMVLYMLLSEQGTLPSSVYALMGSQATGWEHLLHVEGGEYPLDSLADVDSRDAVWSLLRGMVRVDPGQRLTVEQVLSHPWFSD